MGARGVRNFTLGGAGQIYLGELGCISGPTLTIFTPLLVLGISLVRLNPQNEELKVFKGMG